jgi:hypothetical protein
MGPEQWVLGFASGVAEGYHLGTNRKGFDPLTGIDAQGVWAWIDNYCRTHPLDSVQTAAANFVLAHPR